MGIFFENIAQAAGFFIKQSGNNTSKSNTVTESGNSFGATLESLARQALDPNASGVQADNIDNKAVIAERKALDKEILADLIEQQNKIVTLELPESEISRFLTELSFLFTENPPDAPTNPMELLPGAQNAQSPLKASSQLKISFNLAELIKFQQLQQDGKIQLQVSGDNDHQFTQQVDAARLTDLLAAYPDPVFMEVEVLPELRGTGEDSEAVSTFKFDLRQLFGQAPSSKSDKVEGVSILTLNNRPETTMINSHPKYGLDFEAQQSETINNPVKNNIDIGGSIYEYDNLSGLFDENNKISLSLLNSMNKTTSHRDVIKYNSDDNNNNKENGGAGRTTNDNKDESSALSREIAGPPKIASGKPVAANSNLFNALTGQNNASSILSRDGEIPFLKNLETGNTTLIENIKENILNSISRGYSIVRMKLQPENLGEMNIRLHLKSGTLSAEFRVEHSKAAEAVSSILPNLKAHLEEANLKLSAINVVIDNRGKGLFSGQNSHFGFGSAGGGHHKRGESSFSGYSEPDDNPVTDDIPDNRRVTGSIHRGWVDLKA